MFPFGSVLNVFYKWWYGAEVYSQYWRNVNWDSKSELERSVKSLTPSNPAIGNLHILLHGAVGAGKSSFVNSLNSAFQHRITTKVKAAPSSATSCTKTYTGHSVKHGSETLPITIFDFMGLEEKAQNVHSEDLTSALRGHLPDGYTLQKQPLSSGDPHYIRNPSNEQKTHCLVCVVSANTISGMPSATIERMRDYLQEASELGIPQAVIMTMGDKLCPAVKYDVKNIYLSKAIKKKMEECSNMLQVQMSCIFPVKNYSEETETNNDMDVLLLLALKQIIHFANDYVEDL